jgi:kumamolisin
VIPTPSRLQALLWLLVALVLSSAHGATLGSDHTVLANSVRLPDAAGRFDGATRVVRAALTAAEQAEAVNFSVTLRMRNFPELQARVAAGAAVSEAEMEARYRPLPSDFERVSAWLQAQGFSPRLADRTHTTVFVRGAVSGIEAAFGLTFARVAAPDGEYSSAVTAPAVPSELASVILSVNGLQPEFRLRPFRPRVLAAPQAGVVDMDIYVFPSDVTDAYHIPASATGAGQTVAIVGQYAVLASDVASFRSASGLPAMTGTLEAIQVNGPSGVAPSGTPDEESLDVEWFGAIAPAANIRQYLSSDVFDGFARIQNDLPAFPSMRVVSMSYGATEASEGGLANLEPYVQMFASLAASGVTVLAASGDAGSNPSGLGTEGDYSASAPLAVEYPASDPSVTGVGGTTLNLTGNSVLSSEVVWNDIAASKSATGGGVSSLFARPSWQTGGTVLAAESMRCVPDVAALSDANFTNVNVGAAYELATYPNVGVLVFENGSAVPDLGTSLATPVWAGIAVLLNQSRAAGGLGSIGFLNPHLYPLEGTSSLNDITSGNNPNYSAGPGYDLCSGLGSPDVAQLLQTLGAEAVPTVRLINISSRAQVNTGANIMIAGFVIAGPSGSTKSVLVRGIGPALAGFGVAGALAQPVITVYDSTGAAIATDSGWGNAPTTGTSAVAATVRSATAADMSTVGAFSLTAGSLDSAMVLTLPDGSYTLQVVGANSTTGIGLGEVYELATNVPAVLSNISTRCFVGTGAQLAIAGFVVQGSSSQLLVRGVGPALTAFGVAGALAQPSIAIYDSSSALIVSNTGWGNAPAAGTSSVAASYRAATAADMSAVGAFALTAGSADSAVVVTLPAGSYTAQISGVGGTTGTALAEVYQMATP